MNQRRNKGFTIVELVIVIAVIAILAAVLIPTFASLIKKANMSVDMQMVRQMNTILSAEEVVDGKPATVVEAKQILIDNGVTDFIPSETLNVYYWVGSENRVMLWTYDSDEKTTGKVVYPDDLVKKYKDVHEPSADWANLAIDYSIHLVVPEDGQTLPEALIDAVKNAESGDVLQLPKNSTLELALSELGEALIMDGNIGKSLTIDLNESTINNSNSYALNIPVSGELILLNGVLKSEKINYDPNESQSAITVDTGAKLVMRNMEYAASGNGIYPEGDASEVIIANSVIMSKGFGIATNNTTSDNIHISVNNAKINAYNNADGFTGIMINVPGLLDIDNSTIEGDYQGIIVRGSTAVIKNSVIAHTEESWAAWGYTSDSHAAENKWKSANDVNIAALTIGNRNNSAYQEPSNVTLINTTVTGFADWPAMYVCANSGDGLGVTLTYDANCVFNGDVVYGNSGANITVNGSAAPSN